MRPRATHLLLLADYAIGMIFALSVFLVGGAAYALGGTPKSYERAAMGSIYTAFLARVETSAHELRADYCARADAVARAEANCQRTRA